MLLSGVEEQTGGHKHELVFKEEVFRNFNYYEGVGYEKADVYICIRCKEKFLLSHVSNYRLR